MKIFHTFCIALLCTTTACVADVGSQQTQKDSEIPVTQTAAVQETPVGESFQVKFETSKGDIVLQINPEWSPLGAKQFKEAIEAGVYDDARFFRVIEGFMVQFGIAGDPAVSAVWRDKNIKDEPVKQSNKRGYITYAKSGAPNSRTTQVFINLVNNPRLDGMGFAPFGQVIEGMDVVDSLYNEYGEGAPSGRGPDQGRVQQEGNAYLKARFPKLDHIIKATIIEGSPASPAL